MLARPMTKLSRGGARPQRIPLAGQSPAAWQHKTTPSRSRAESRAWRRLVEQNAHMALSVADCGYVLETGRLEALWENDDARAAYLGSRKVGEIRPPSDASREEA